MQLERLAALVLGLVPVNVTVLGVDSSSATELGGQLGTVHVDGDAAPVNGCIEELGFA